MSVLIFLIILVLLILVHEFGHFIVAKTAGIRVDEFGIGFPPKLWGKKIGQTEYTINAIPFGGFVRIFGEDPNQDSIAGPDSSRSFVHRSWYTQLLVIVAGVVMNVLFAYVLFVLGFMLGMPQAIEPEEFAAHPEARLIVSDVLANSPAATAGLMPGDHIQSISVKGKAVEQLDPQSVSNFIASLPNTPIDIQILRGGEEKHISAIPKAGLIQSEPSRAILGFGLGLVTDAPLSFLASISRAFIVTGDMLSRIAVSLVHFFVAAFTLTADFSQISGPVGIVGLVGDASALGITALISFTALISLNLAVVNMLPFPALDGGRFVMIIIETIKGSRISPQFANALNSIGFFILLALMALVTVHDILKLIG